LTALIKPKYCIAIWDLDQSNPEIEKAKQLTYVTVRSAYMHDIIEGTDIDTLLQFAANTKYEYCIVMQPGHIIYNKAFFKYIEHWINSVDFFITGHIIDRHDYYGLHRQCILVNLKYYKQFNTPKFGKACTNQYVSTANRSLNNIHHDYTPTFLKPASDIKLALNLLEGWNFINVSLQNNLTVYNFHNTIRGTKMYLYPNKDNLAEKLEWLKQIESTATKSVFFWNTETKHEVLRVKNKYTIQHLYSVAAGFKPNFMLSHIGYNSNTKVTYYDYSREALAFKNYLINNWDGIDYPSIIKTVLAKYNIIQNKINPTGDDNHSVLWQDELKFWGGPAKFQDEWQKYKRLKHNFIHCDLINSPSSLTNVVDNSTGILWFSNIYHTLNAHYTYSIKELKDAYNTLIILLRQKNPELKLFGKDHTNRNLRHISVSDDRCIIG